MLTMKDQFFLTPPGQWILKHKRILSITACAILGWVGWQGGLELHAAREKEKPLEDIFSAWKKQPEEKTLYQSLRKAAKQASGPSPIHAEIAQVLLSLDRVDEAEPLARASLDQLRKVAPAYAEFAEISLLICRKNYQKALERAVSLKEALEEKGSLLYGKNLVRIAFLQQQLENGAGETAAWSELKELIGSQRDSRIWQGLAHRESDFHAYLEERKKDY